MGGGLLLLALRFNPSQTLSQPPPLGAEGLNFPWCRLEGGHEEVKEQGYLGSSSSVLM